MNVKPTIGIEFDDKYINARSKFIDFVAALNELTPRQKDQLAKECIASMGMAASLEQFINYVNNGGRL